MQPGGEQVGAAISVPTQATEKQPTAHTVESSSSASLNSKKRKRSETADSDSNDDNNERKRKSLDTEAKQEESCTLTLSSLPSGDQSTAELGRPFRGKCLYQSRKCDNERAVKRNGKAHNLCEEHRSKQNQHQRKFDAKKFSRRRRKDSVSSKEEVAVDTNTQRTMHNRRNVPLPIPRRFSEVHSLSHPGMYGKHKLGLEERRHYEVNDQMHLHHQHHELEPYFHPMLSTPTASSIVSSIHSASDRQISLPSQLPSPSIASNSQITIQHSVSGASMRSALEDHGGQYIYRSLQPYHHDSRYTQFEIKEVDASVATPTSSDRRSTTSLSHSELVAASILVPSSSRSTNRLVQYRQPSPVGSQSSPSDNQYYLRSLQNQQVHPSADLRSREVIEDRLTLSPSLNTSMRGYPPRQSMSMHSIYSPLAAAPKLPSLLPRSNSVSTGVYASGNTTPGIGSGRILAPPPGSTTTNQQLVAGLHRLPSLAPLRARSTPSPDQHTST